MTTKEDVVLVDIIGNVVSSMKVAGINSINYEPGRSIQIMKSLNDLDNSITSKGLKYPLIAMVLPIRESRGKGFYATATIPRIVIATIVSGTNDVFTRYQDGGSFKTILYPCYYEFLRRLSMSVNVIGSDPDNFPHEKMDNPGNQPIGEGSTDFVDTIEILNLELNLSQIKTC